jgi:hypothetical protein
MTTDQMSDTPRTDAVQGGLECATELPEDWEKCFQWMAGHARSLERENAELSDQVMRWFKAASPYATPGSLEEGLKNLERALVEAHPECRCHECTAIWERRYPTK